MADEIEDPRSDKDRVFDYADNIIKISVGHESKVFQVHEKLLRQNSGYFDAALKTEWQEGRDKTVQLLEEDSDTFNRFLGWLYTRQIACKKDVAIGHSTLGKLYVLGERLLACESGHAVLDAMVIGGRADRMWPSWKTVNVVHEGTPTGSPARKLLVDMYTQRSMKSSFADGIADANLDFLRDLVAALIVKNLRDDNGTLMTDTSKACHTPAAGET